ncbi:MAG: hypothetical protein QOJ79_756 [Actinomycetota bacterium]|jgi:hypothetical protein|nr:hypothetical protein [Actinomycetota bacterium]
MTQSADLLIEIDEHGARTRARAAAGWLPLLLAGLAMLGAFPAYAGWWDGPAGGCICTSDGAPWWDRLGVVGLGGGSRPVGLYWLAVVPVVYAASAGWFAMSARRTGLRQRWGLHLLAGLGTAGVAVVLAVARVAWLPWSPGALFTPLLALAVGLVALGLVERDRVVTSSGAAVAVVAVAVSALARHSSHLPDSGLGNVGQALLAPSVEVAGLGLVLVGAAAYVRSANKRTASVTPTAPPAVPA